MSGRNAYEYETRFLRLTFNTFNLDSVQAEPKIVCEHNAELRFFSFVVRCKCDKSTLHPKVNTLLHNRKSNKFYYEVGKQIAPIDILNNIPEEHTKCKPKTTPWVPTYEFFENFPNLANRIPLSYLASYLGITQSSLSRIRKNIS